MLTFSFVWLFGENVSGRKLEMHSNKQAALSVKQNMKLTSWKMYLTTGLHVSGHF